MVRALEEEQEQLRSRLFHFKGMHENAGRQAHSMIIDGSGALSPVNDGLITSRSQASKPLNNEPVEKQRIGFILHRNDKGLKSRFQNDEGAESPRSKEKHPSDMELMKERFSKLLLGEDMSGGGKGVSSALALSNAITNLAASVFGEQRRLEPMAPERKARWRKEIDWLLSVTDHIVEFVPSKQKNKDGTHMEIMSTRQRTDLHMNIPALRKLDAMLIDCLDNFKEQNEFTYMSKDDDKNKRRDDKWWIPTPKVPPNGLSESTRKWLQFQKDSVNQVLKAALAINAQVITEMEIPENYIDSLPKNGRASLGDSIYRSITVGEYFDPDHFLSTMDLSSEHKILDLKNRIEASVVIWKRKMNAKDGKSAWGSAVSLEKRELFEERAETILLIMKQRFLGIPQSALEISKIEYNRDVGQAVLESYSRILESLAFTVMSRIEDVLQADNLERNPSHGEQKQYLLQDSSQVMRGDKFPHTKDELEKLNSVETMPSSMTLSDFMGWTLDQGENETKKDSTDNLLREKDAKALSKPQNIVTNKKLSYIERLETLGGLRSPTARH
ncbi:Rop guanine nucleotide exchange factor 12 [Camellia lanceoleosa]|uniref:Rop guanine nucleotide exchange factor 12 n=1 Tax=Camellia lanceoleosa TaxID=1840588 RepID=A0ACC0F9P5_9ERIC|nr:Rop guanine nucleotide exchange factor 12 [Camellia lanceoleosa]